jgi:glutathione-regulated potassium-efflux system ancillary protein KefG
MKTLVIVAHPNLAGSRINQRLVQEVRMHPEITVHELYASYPDWVIDVPREQELLEKHDRIVLQFPLYWYSTPPLLKKWQDDVLSYGWAYGSQGKKLQGKELLVATSIGGRQEVYQAGGRNHFTMSEILRPLQATSNMCRMTYLPAFVVDGASDEDQLAEVARRYTDRIRMLNGS